LSEYRRPPALATSAASLIAFRVSKRGSRKLAGVRGSEDSPQRESVDVDVLFLPPATRIEPARSRVLSTLLETL
jgi:hypothetical protein